MSTRIACGDVVALVHPLEAEITLSVMLPVPAYIEEPLKLMLPGGAQGVVEKLRGKSAYLRIVASENFEVRRWIHIGYLQKVG